MKLFVLFLAFLVFLPCSVSVRAQDKKPECPSITVTGPAGITQQGEKFRFSGAVEGNLPRNVAFEWAVSGGKIVDGQGTLNIKVDADWKDGASVTATLEVIGLPEGCPTSDSETAGATGGLEAVFIEEFGKRPKADIEARLRKFFVELANNPNSQGYIVNYGADKEIRSREQLIVKYVAFRRFDRSRITIVRGGTHASGTVYTKLYRVPPGAENPPP